MASRSSRAPSAPRMLSKDHPRSSASTYPGSFSRLGRNRSNGSSSRLASRVLLLVPLHPFGDFLLRFPGVAPPLHLYPFPRFEVLVVREEVADLGQHHLGQV